MTTVNPKLLASRAEEFYKELSSTPNERYLSWEHCYDVFNSGSKDIDYLSLHLAFYLASWGMYRGSSFLLRRDYKVHYGAVKILLNDEYDELRGVECRNLSNERISTILRLYGALEKFYEGVRNDVHKFQSGIGFAGNEIRSAVSQTLITKIMMGTLGCSPAYDRYFVRGLEGLGISKTFSRKSLEGLVRFYQDNRHVFDRVKRRTRSGKGLPYPQMKILDMAFWKQGFYLENDNKKDGAQ